MGWTLPRSGASADASTACVIRVGAVSLPWAYNKPATENTTRHTKAAEIDRGKDRTNLSVVITGCRSCDQIVPECPIRSHDSQRGYDYFRRIPGGLIAAFRADDDVLAEGRQSQCGRRPALQCYRGGRHAGNRGIQRYLVVSGRQRQRNAAFYR